MTKGSYRNELRKIRRWIVRKGWVEGFSSVTIAERLDYLVEREANAKAVLMVTDLTKRNDDLQFAVWAMAQEVGIKPEEFTLDLLKAKVKELAAKSD